MNPLRVALLLALLPLLALAGSGCANDCDSFCSRQGRFIDRCLPQFEQSWSDVNADWANKGDFVAACGVMVDERITEDIDATCANAEEGADRNACESTVRQSIYDACAEDLNKFEQSCTDFWRDETDFLPGTFDPPPEPGDDDDDDDDSAGDDDDSAGDDDDSAGDDDDSAL